MIKTIGSFRQAIGQPSEIIPILKDMGYQYAHIADIGSTFMWVKWKEECEKHGLQPVFGVSLYVTDNPSAKRPRVDLWSFYAIDDIAAVNRLVRLATSQFRYNALLTYQQAMDAEGVIKVAGYNADLGLIEPQENLFIGLSPACAKGFVNAASEKGFTFVDWQEQRYPKEEDFHTWEVACGRNARETTYPRHILSYDEWLEENLKNIGFVPDTCLLPQECFEKCTATLKQGTMIKPERPMSLRDMCIAGAEKIGLDLSQSEYKERLNLELQVIADKEFEDYFFLVADLVQNVSKTQLVGPGRGSSAGSLVCYLLGITQLDPIKHGLLFFRFLSPERVDLPDCDIDFADRDAAVEYLVEKYGIDRVAKLGTLAKWQAKNTTNEVCKALLISRPEAQKVLDVIPDYAAGDSRGDTALRDALENTPEGKNYLKKYPEFKIAGEMAGNASHAGVHAAGVVVTNDPIDNFIAVNSQKNSTMCDLKEAEALNLLKLDVLGLDTLTIVDECLKLAGLPRDHLKSLPLDDQKAFQVLNDRKYLGIFQFESTVIGLAKEFYIQSFDDISALMALGRPGPLSSGAAHRWLKKRQGQMEVDYPHEVLKPYLEATFGELIYQETLMQIAHEVAGMDWATVSKLRKAVGKSQGEAAMRGFEIEFVDGLVSAGIERDIAERFWQQILGFGAYGFNKCLAGSTKIRMANPNGYLPKEVSIEKLYDMYIANPTKSVKDQRRRPNVISLFDDGIGKPQRIWDIHYSGEKECYKFTFDDGSDVVCTKNHQFVINGGWSAIGNADIGDKFTSLEKDPTNVNLNGRGQGHAKGTSYLIPNEGFLSGEANPSWVNGCTPAYNKFKELCRKEDRPCEKCNKRKSRMEVHHNDFNRGWDRPDDLSYLCVSCHKKVHYAHGRTKAWGKGMLQAKKTLVKVEYHGIEKTYDLEMPDVHNFMLANGIVTHNSHAKCYAVICYWTAYLKAHFPLHFAAASLTQKSDPEKQLDFLRELDKEGVGYVPVDPELSTDKWRVINNKLIGPLTTVHGLGTAMQRQILSARARNEPLPDRALKLLDNPKTKIDELYPIKNRIENLDKSIFASEFKLPHEIKADGTWQENLLVVGVVEKCSAEDENTESRIQGRLSRGQQGRYEGPHKFVELRVASDSGSLYTKIGRKEFQRLSPMVVGKVKEGETLIAVRGKLCPMDDFELLLVDKVRILEDG